MNATSNLTDEQLALRERQAQEYAEATSQYGEKWTGKERYRTKPRLSGEVVDVRDWTDSKTDEKVDITEVKEADGTRWSVWHSLRKLQFLFDIESPQKGDHVTYTFLGDVPFDNGHSECDFLLEVKRGGDGEFVPVAPDELSASAHRPAPAPVGGGDDDIGI